MKLEIVTSHNLRLLGEPTVNLQNAEGIAYWLDFHSKTLPSDGFQIELEEYEPSNPDNITGGKLHARVCDGEENYILISLFINGEPYSRIIEDWQQTDLVHIFELIEIDVA